VKKEGELSDSGNERLSLNLAIVGGGATSRFFLELVQKDAFPSLTINIVGLCDIDPEAEGVRLARELGVFTTENYGDLFKIKDLDGVIELTHNREVLLDLIRMRPRGLLVLDHNIVPILQSIYPIYKKLKPKEQEVILEKMVSEFLMEHAYERVLLLNPDFTIVDANRGYLTAVEKQREDVIGAHCYKITHGFSSPCSEWEPEMGCPLLETVKTGQPSHLIHEHTTEKNQRTYCDLETYPVKNEQGEVVRVIEIGRDVTSELASRWEVRVKELKADMQKLVQEDRLISLGKLSASCAHEINNPIQGLLTFSHLMLSILENGEPSQEDMKQFKAHLSLMSRELERCGDIVTGLLSFARESSPETREVEINDIIRAVISLTRHRMELQNIHLDARLSTEPLHVRGDVNQLQQCFLNLIFNAIEAMPEGGNLLIASKLDRDTKSAQVIFQDFGYGITEKDIDRIFDPFFTTKPEGEGTGLGLSIVYGIVKGYDGSISVKSDVGEGSTFTLSFPSQ